MAIDGGSSDRGAGIVAAASAAANVRLLLPARARRRSGRGRGAARGLLEAVGPAELLAEPLHAAGGVDELLLAGEERVAIAANVDRQLLLRAAGLKRVAACAVNGADLVLGVNLLFHGNLLAAVVRREGHDDPVLRRQPT